MKVVQYMSGVPCVGQLAEVPADFRDRVTCGNAAHLSINRPLLGNDDRLTVDVHVERMLDKSILVTGCELVDPSLRAEDSHQSELADVPDEANVHFKSCVC